MADEWREFRYAPWFRMETSGPFKFIGAVMCKAVPGAQLRVAAGNNPNCAYHLSRCLDEPITSSQCVVANLTVQNLRQYFVPRLTAKRRNGLADWPSANPTRARCASLPCGQVPVCRQCATLCKNALLATRKTELSSCPDDTDPSFESRPSQAAGQIRE